MKKIVLSILVLVFASISVFAQLKHAKKKYASYEYATSLEIFLKHYKRDSTKQELALLIADCYHQMNQPRLAEGYYRRAEALGTIDSAKVYLDFGKTLKSNHKYDEAKAKFEHYLKLKPNDVRGKSLSKSVDIVKGWLKEKDKYKVEAVPHLNSAESDFSPAFFKTGLVITSDRRFDFGEKNIFEWTGKSFLDLIYIEQDSTKHNFGKGKDFSDHLNHNHHDGPATFNQELDHIFFTRVSIYDTLEHNWVNRLKTFKSEYKHGHWKEPTPFFLNSDEYSVGHPALSASGDTLYYSSDMPGGYGMADVYYSVRNGESWGEPVNLGPTVNTFGSEVFPYIHKNGKLLFSSDGHTGYGGLDIFITEQVNGVYMVPENLRSPMNSSADDFGIILDDQFQTGYMSSDRYGGLGDDDIYSFSIVSDIPFNCKELNPKDLCVTLDHKVEYVDTNKLYLWNMGDGNLLTGAEITHCYDYPGKFTVTADVIDKAAKFITFKKRTLELDYTKDYQSSIKAIDKAPINSMIRFDGRHSSFENLKITSYNWTFGDGFERTDSISYHSYKDTGVYNVSLTVTAKTASGKDSVACTWKKVTILDKVTYPDLFLHTHSGQYVDGYVTENDPYNNNHAIVTIIGEPKSGTYKVTENVIRYTPNASFIGTDTVRYQITYKHSPDIIITKDLIVNVTSPDKIDPLNLRYPVTFDIRDRETNKVINDATVWVYSRDQDIMQETTVKDGVVWVENRYKYQIKLYSPNYLTECYELDVNSELQKGKIVELKMTKSELFKPISLENIYYGYDKFHLRAKAKESLHELAHLLKVNPGFAIELSSHTDKRGSEKYNQQLSQKRAESAVNFLIEEGVSETRLVSRGYGESRLLNTCKPKPCTKEEHQANRRTEFTLIGSYDKEHGADDPELIKEKIRADFKASKALYCD